jgi:hypothetical protein
VREVEPAAPGRKEGFPFGGSATRGGARRGGAFTRAGGVAVGSRSVFGYQGGRERWSSVTSPSMTCPRVGGGEVSGKVGRSDTQLLFHGGQPERTAVRCRL